MVDTQASGPDKTDKVTSKQNKPKGKFLRRLVLAVTYAALVALAIEVYLSSNPVTLTLGPGGATLAAIGGVALAAVVVAAVLFALIYWLLG